MSLVRTGSVATRPGVGTKSEFFTPTAAKRDQAEARGASMSRSDKHLRTGPTRASGGAVLHPFRMGGSRGDRGDTVGLGIKVKHLIICPIHLGRPVRSMRSSSVRRRLDEGRGGYSRLGRHDIGGIKVVVVGSGVRPDRVQDGGVVLSAKSPAQ